MMDLWATVPYYTAYLSRALLAEGVDVQVGSISYYLDLTCFSGRGLRLDPGLLDVVGRFKLPQAPRRILKLVEALLNMLALTLRFLFTPPDIVHVQYLPMLRWRLPLDTLFLTFCRSRGSRIVLTVHDLLPHDTAESYRLVFRKLYHFVDGIICHSDHVLGRLVAEFDIPAAKISVIPHGPFFYDLPETDTAETSHRLNLPADQVLVLWQGIIFPYKGLDVLLDAWQRVEAETSAATLVVAGTGAPNLLDALRTRIQHLGLQRVKLDLRFISTEDLVALYRTANIVVYPYRAITTSGALATGLALGKTIIASDLPVFRELLVHRENAILIDPNSTTELSAALIELISDQKLRHRLAAQVVSMNFGTESWLRIASQTAAFYSSVLTSRRML